jgi:murein DD-endopeptidase MepM/ murein hydrolase activator NlpD
VVDVKSDSDVGGDDSKYDWDANYILIQHSDGTLAQYVHLMKGGSKVELGQRVKAGEWIGLSGNTGHSTGPHLHFSVFKAKDGAHRQTIPVRYRTADNFDAVLEEGKTYSASSSFEYAATSRSEAGTLPQPDRWIAFGGAAQAAPHLLSSGVSRGVGH